ncbi:MAG: hydrogenase [Polyangiaceae bacterium]|nr:hydrogenase [Polyangiaceae bacterium]
MVLAALILVPLGLALVALLWPVARQRPWLLPLGGVAHLVLSIVAVAGRPEQLTPWLGLDPIARLLLVAVSVLFLATSLYTPGYLALKPGRDQRVFTACLLALLGMISAILAAQHLGLMWVALEACTLTTAPLLYFHRNARSLEALWKYLLVGSVGIAIAFLGTLFLAYSALHAGLKPSLVLSDLVGDAPRLSRPWLHSGFVLLFIGYGTKMGLAPMHTWKPDAYGEASGLVGTLLAGGVSSAAFLAILRFHKILVAAGDGAFGRQIMLVAGLLSIAVAAAFMARLRDFKRLLAYSSVEHMGILVLGVGIGGGATLGAMLHLVNNALVKGVLFLAAGNIHRVYGSKRAAAPEGLTPTPHEGERGEAADEADRPPPSATSPALASSVPVSGLLRRLPWSGALLLLGFLAVTGSPPFGTFVSELTIVRGAFATGHGAAGVAFLGLLFVVFVGMGSTVLAMAQGPAPSTVPAERRDTLLTIAPVVALLACVLGLGLYLPAGLQTAFAEAAAWLEGP